MKLWDIIIFTSGTMNVSCSGSSLSLLTQLTQTYSSFWFAHQHHFKKKVGVVMAAKVCFKVTMFCTQKKCLLMKLCGFRLGTNKNYY
jgi:hypothetical protein